MFGCPTEGDATASGRRNRAAAARHGDDVRFLDRIGDRLRSTLLVLGMCDGRILFLFGVFGIANQAARCGARRGTDQGSGARMSSRALGSLNRKKMSKSLVLMGSI